MSGIVCLVLTVYWVILIVKIIASWVIGFSGGRSPGGIARTALGAVDAVTDPVLRLVRGVLPPIAIGRMGLDLSPIIVFIVLGILLQAVCG